MNAADRIIMAKVSLQKEQPFFSYILMKMKISANNNIPTMGIDAKGNVFYNETFIENLQSGETKGVLVHELLHHVLEHMSRLDNRKKKMFNIATDIVVNNIVIENDFKLPKEGLIPSSNSIMVGNLWIEKISEKTAEQIYNELESAKKGEVEGDFPVGSEEGKGDGNDNNGIDHHEYGNTSGKIQKELKKLVAEASRYADMQGKIPYGMEKIIDNIINGKMPWKNLLCKYIINEIPNDFSWSRPSKKSIANGIYLPSMKKETVDVIIALDTSGSIDGKELKDFMGEIKSIAGSFNNVKMTVLVADCEIQGVYDIDKFHIDDVKLSGGGGTDHAVIFNWIAENKPDAKILIAFTDGYTDFPDEETVKTIWVCNTDKVFPFGEVIRI